MFKMCRTLTHLPKFLSWLKTSKKVYQMNVEKRKHSNKPTKAKQVRHCLQLKSRTTLLLLNACLQGPLFILTEEPKKEGKGFSVNTLFWLMYFLLACKVIQWLLFAVTPSMSQDSCLLVANSYLRVSIYYTYHSLASSWRVYSTKTNWNAVWWRRTKTESTTWKRTPSWKYGFNKRYRNDSWAEKWTGDTGHRRTKSGNEQRFVKSRIGTTSLSFGPFKDYLATQLDTQGKKLESKQKIDKETVELKYKGNQKQFRVNAELENILEQIQTANQKGANDQSITDLAKEGKKIIRKRQKLIKIADKCTDGWKVVEEYESDELASDSKTRKSWKKPKKPRERNVKLKSRNDMTSRGKNRIVAALTCSFFVVRLFVFLFFWWGYIAMDMYVHEDIKRRLQVTCTLGLWYYYYNNFIIIMVI